MYRYPIYPMYNYWTNRNSSWPMTFYPHLNHTQPTAPPDPDEQLKTIMLLYGNFLTDPTLLHVLPIEVLFQVVTPLLRESYLKSLGAPLHIYHRNGELVYTREYTIADYIQEKGQPSNRNGEIILMSAGITSLSGIERIENPDSITYLNLSHNFLSSYVQPDLRSSIDDPRPPHPFSRFKNLQKLILSNNKYDALPDHLFKGLSSLTFLALSENYLEEVPETLFHNLASLHYLNLSHNRLSTLPSFIFQAPFSLQELYLSSNHLTDLPDNLFHPLVSLQKLNLFDNHLRILSGNLFHNLHSLKELELNDNHLNALPRTIFQGLSSLRTLNLGYNSLNDLPSSLFQGLSSLRTLYLNNNYLTILPEDLFHGLTSLLELWLDRNRLNTLSPSLFRGLTSLMIVHIQFNWIPGTAREFKDNHKAPSRYNLEFYPQLIIERVYS